MDYIMVKMQSACTAVPVSHYKGDTAPSVGASNIYLFECETQAKVKITTCTSKLHWKKKIQKTKGRRQKIAVKQNYDFLRIVSFVETLMNSERYIVVLDLFGDQESVNMRRWCLKINWGTLPPSAKVAAVVHVS